MTTPLSQKEQTTRKLVLISLLFLPLLFVPAALLFSAENSLLYLLTVAGIILTIALDLLAWFTRDRAPAIIALLLPFTSIPLTFLALLFNYGRNW